METDKEKIIAFDNISKIIIKAHIQTISECTYLSISKKENKDYFSMKKFKEILDKKL